MQFKRVRAKQLTGMENVLMATQDIVVHWHMSQGS